jgi:hypothetical protein
MDTCGNFPLRFAIVSNGVRAKRTRCGLLGKATCERSHQSERQRTLRLPPLLQSLKAEHPLIQHHSRLPRPLEGRTHLAVPGQCTPELTVPAMQQVLETGRR